MLLLTACAGPAVADPGEDGRGLPPGWVLRLPAEQEAWRPQLAEEISAAVVRAEAILSRWPIDEAAPGGLRELRVITPAEAEHLYTVTKWAGDPRVPRTFPARRLAVVPLPRADRLLRGTATPDGPPKTWLHDLQHEAMHLASLDRPGLADAPRWFQEGLAESVCGRADGVQPTWPRWDLADEWAPKTSEGLQRARAHAVRKLLADNESQTPWQDVAAPQPVGGAAIPHRALRGRHAGWWPQEGRYLLAPPAGALVSLDLLPRCVGRTVPVSLDGGPPDSAVASWFGTTPLRFRLTAGDSGRYPDAGLLVASETEGGGWLRIRITGEDRLGVRAEGPQVGLAMIELYPPQDARPGGMRAPGREVELRLQDGILHVVSGSLREHFPLAAHGLTPPFELRLYAFDTAVRIDIEPPTTTP